MKKEEVELGMVFKFGNNTEIEHVVVSLYADDVALEQINHRSPGISNRHACGYGWFDSESTTFIRKMDGNELLRYQTRDPVCDLEPGIYRLKKDIVDIDFKTLANDGEVINVLSVNCEKNPYGASFYLEIIFKRFGYIDTATATFYENSTMACIHFFWKILKRININS